MHDELFGNSVEFGRFFNTDGNATQENRGVV